MSILGIPAGIEVAARLAYWRSRRLHDFLTKRRAREWAPEEVSEVTLEDLMASLRLMGTTPGDILIVHSDNGVVARIRESPRIINEALLSLVEPGGTLVMPAYPILRGGPTGFDYLHYEEPLPIMTFDVRRTAPWTGVLGMDLMRMPGATRSCLPINTLAAFGEESRQMFAHELDAPIAFPCGKGSAWEYCASRNAKVLALGVDLAHSLTLNHVAEDIDPDRWPVREWYRRREYETRDGETAIRGFIWERQPKWTQYYAERRLARDLVRDRVARQISVGGITMQLVEAKDHLAYLSSRRNSTYPYFCIPRSSRRDR